MQVGLRRRQLWERTEGPFQLLQGICSRENAVWQGARDLRIRALEHRDGVRRVPSSFLEAHSTRKIHGAVHRHESGVLLALCGDAEAGAGRCVADLAEQPGELGQVSRLESPDFQALERCADLISRARVRRVGHLQFIHVAHPLAKPPQHRHGATILARDGADGVACHRVRALARQAARPEPDARALADAVGDRFDLNLLRHAVPIVALWEIDPGLLAVLLRDHADALVRHVAPLKARFPHVRAHPDGAALQTRDLGAQLLRLGDVAVCGLRQRLAGALHGETVHDRELVQARGLLLQRSPSALLLPQVRKAEGVPTRRMHGTLDQPCADAAL
mmetsp:Transcript_174097/g.558195  ORF Transcript_174097/g.558195 Transcript_174097/m.558195 type:complete len:333 (-) Transcript_174097:275-1273(-)